MPLYSYRALTKTGQEVKNKVEDVSRYNLIKKIKNNGFIPISVVQINTKNRSARGKQRTAKNIDTVLKSIGTKPGNVRRRIKLSEQIKLLVAGGERIKPRDVMVFTQNFYLLKKANFNNIHALSTIIDGTENLTFRVILEEILSGLEAGESMYTTMEYYPSIFPYIYTNIIKVGELSGSLTQSLNQAIQYLDKASDMKKKIRAILVPNLLQFGGILIMLVLGTLIAIPQIQNVLDSVGSADQLPGLTLWFKGFLERLMAHWYIPVSIIIATVVGIIAYIRTPKGRYNFHYFKYKMPIFGKLIYAMDFERFIRSVLLNIQNGMRIQDAIEVSKNVTKNYVMLSMAESAINNIIIGQSWIEPFERSGLSSPMITEMLKVGMQTDLSEMMAKLLEYMEIDIENILGKIMKVLPQVVYGIVGVVLIFFVLVVLVPMIQVYMGSFLFSAAGV